MITNRFILGICALIWITDLLAPYRAIHAQPFVAAGQTARDALLQTAARMAEDLGWSLASGRSVTPTLQPGIIIGENDAPSGAGSVFGWVGGEKHRRGGHR